MKNTKEPSLIKAYFRAWDLLEKATHFINSCFVGFWLGVLKRDQLHRIDRAYYDKEKMYFDEQYNRRGLFNWENEVIEEYYRRCKHILLIGAGGGREVLALDKLGHIVDGYEPHPEFVKLANDLLTQEGAVSRVELMSREHCPEGLPVYDGLIVGWGAYMLIQGKERRVAFLRQMHSRAQPNAPILLSFFSLENYPRRYTLIFKIANLVRGILNRERIDLGDDLAPNYVHFFTEDQIKNELEEGGFGLRFYSTRTYGHAVGIAT